MSINLYPSMGWKLTRNLGIAFSIMGLLPSIASTLAYSLPAGPAGLVWVGLTSFLYWVAISDDEKGMVYCKRIHHGCRPCNGRPGQRNANLRRSILVESGIPP